MRKLYIYVALVVFGALIVGLGALVSDPMAFNAAGGTILGVGLFMILLDFFE